MAWTMKKAERQGDVLSVTFARSYTDTSGTPQEETHVVRHYRTSFGGKQQTLAEWLVNAKREFKLRLDGLNAPAEPTPTDVTAQLS